MLKDLAVLIADSNSFLASLTVSMLKGIGVQSVSVVADSAGVLLALHRQHYDVIILDDQLQPVDGIDLTRQVRADGGERRAVPIIMVFAEADRERIEQARDAGVTEFIRKPMSAKILESRIVEAMDHPRAFIEAPVYTGPDRRRRQADFSGNDRRQEDDGDPTA